MRIAQMRLEGGKLAVEAQDRRRHQGLLQAIAGVVDQEAGVEIVAAVGDDVVTGEQPLRIRLGQPLAVLDDAHMRVERRKRRRGTLGLLRADPLGAVQYLALDRKSTRLNSSHSCASRMQSSASKQ